MASSLPDRDPSSPTSVAEASFPTKRKGFDPEQVRTFLVAVGGEIERLVERVAELETELSAAVTPIIDLSDLDDATVVAAVGDEATRVLRSAREEAALILERAEETASRRQADASIAAERVVREATEAARRERSEVKGRLREMIDEAERHVERVRLRAERSRESARLWAEQAEHAQRQVVEEFERARQTAVDVIASLTPQRLTDDLDELPEPESELPVVSEVDLTEPQQAANQEVEPDGGDQSDGGQVVQLFGDRSEPTDGSVDGGGADAAEVLIDVPTPRDVALVRILPRAIRRAKRTFTDEQKLILAALDGAAVGDVADLIPGPDEHGASHSSVLRRDLGAAADAGVEAFGSAAGSDAPDLSEAVAVVESAIAGEIRGRLEALVAEHGGDNAAIAQGVRSMYRDLRRDVVEARVTDAVMHAYFAGMMAAGNEGMTCRWLAVPSGSACAECEDDVLAGPVPMGAPFPTGHVAPPAHPGCRCDLVPNHL